VTGNFDPTVQELLKSQNDVVFLLDADLRFLDCSPAWDSFATANGGHGISRDEILGKNILDFTPEVLRGFYEHKYRLAEYHGSWNEFDYHCSSPESIRLFRMSIRPQPDAILVVNHLILDEECEIRPPLTAEERREYISADNLLTMCANCRKVRRLDTQDAWIWIPEFLNETGLQISHGLCPRCFSLLNGDERSGTPDGSP